MIWLTNLSGGKILVGPAHIIRATRLSEQGSLLDMVRGTVSVRETLEQIHTLICEEARQ